MDTPEKKSRIFDPAREPTLYHNMVDGTPYEKPQDCLLHDPGWGIIHLNQYNIRNPDQPEPDDETMVVSIHGAYTNLRTHACIAVYFAPKSTSNFKASVDCEFDNTSEILSLQAAIRAIDLISHHAVHKYEILKRAVIMTCSQYVYKGITEYVWTWEKDHYLVFPFRYTKLRTDWQALQNKVKGLEAFGVSVRWWLVDVGDIAQGVEYADELLVESLRASKLLSGLGPNSRIRPDQPVIVHDHFRSEPPKDLSAQQLFKHIGLEVPELDHQFDIAYTMRRLVLSGQDVANNFTMLFGPDWESQFDVIAQWKKLRLEVLSIVNPAWNLSMVEAGHWNPRLASAEELEQLNHVEDSEATPINEASPDDDDRSNDGEASNKVFTYEQFMPDYNVTN